MSPGEKTAARILLVEFIIIDRFHCGIEFPYIQGLFRQSAMSCQIVSIGLKASSAINDFDDDGTHIMGTDFANLLSAIDEFIPTSIIFSHIPSQTILSDLRKQNKDLNVSYFYCSSNVLTNLENGNSTTITDFWSNQTSTTPKKDRLFEVDADFSSTAINQYAAEHRPLPHLICGTECSYNKSLSTNPKYYETNLSGSIRKSGCAFCYTTDNCPTRHSHQDSLKLLHRHLQNGFTTINWHNHKPRFRILGYTILLQFENFTNIIKSNNFPEADYLFNCRADEIVRLLPNILQGLSNLKGTKNKIFFALIGVENFVQEELNRFNKGISTNTLLKMFTILFKLAKEYPDNFDFREYGGFSTILFTPWSSLADIEFNLRIIDLLDSPKLFGKLFTSRLRLYQSLPIYKLAKQDNLLTDNYTDKIFDTARWNFYAREEPWQFRDQNVDIFNKITARIAKNSAFADDPLYLEVQDWCNTYSINTNNVIHIALIILKVIHNLKTLDISNVLKLAGKKVIQSQKEIDFQKNITDEIDINLDIFSFQKQYRKIGKIDCATEKDITTVKRYVESYLDTICHIKTLPLPQHPGFCELFYSPDIGYLNKALLVADSIKKSIIPIEIQQAIIEIGNLLGYPPCCSKSFSQSTLFEKTSNEWLHVKRRVTHKEEIDKYNNPFFGYCSKYVPCSYTCNETRKRNKEFFASTNIPHLQGRQNDALLLDEPVFLLLDVPGNFIFLKKTDLCEIPGCKNNEPSYELSYMIASSTGATDTRTHYILQGNKLHIHPGIIEVYDNDIFLYSFIMSAFIWWTKTCFHRNFWKLCTQIAETEKTSSDASNTSNERDFFEKDSHKNTFNTSTEAVYFREIQSIISHVSPLILKKTAYQLKHMQFSNKSAILSFEKDLKLIQFIASPAHLKYDGLFKGKYFVLSHRKDTPISNDSELTLAKMLFYSLEKTNHPNAK